MTKWTMTFRWLWLLLCLLIGVPVCTGQQRQRPNVLLIMVDDMGYGDIRMGGNPGIRTPNLDRLAVQSVRFANFYVSPVCAPTRASLLTGRYAQRAGVLSVTNGFETLRPGEVTVAELLSANGYRTGLFGKWHLGENYPSVPTAQGFSEFIGFRTGHFADYFDPRLEHNGQPYPTKGYITDVLTNEAIRFMQQTPASQPFFCYLPYNAPHTPLDAPERYLATYRGKGPNERVERIYAMMESVDDNVGRLMAFLRRAGLDKNTVVLFLSDNGPIDGFRAPPAEWRYNAGLRDQKFTVYEGGIRTRFFARWPGHFLAGRTVDTMAAHIDVLPTLLGLCGLKKPDSLQLDGLNLEPLLTTRAPAWPARTLFLNYSLTTLRSPAPYPGGIARTQRYKMVNGTELYDLKTDPGESRNLAAELPQQLTELDQQYRAWWRQMYPAGTFDRLPIAVGYDAEPVVRLAPHLGRATGGLAFTGYRGLYGKDRTGVHPNGVDGDWVANWTQPNDSLTWQIRVVEPARYTVLLNIRSNNSGRGAVVRVKIGDQVLDQPVPVTNAPTGVWTPVSWGDVVLRPGSYELSVQALAVGNGEGMQLGSVAIVKQAASGK